MKARALALTVALAACATTKPAPILIRPQPTVPPSVMIASTTTTQARPAPPITVSRNYNRYAATTPASATPGPSALASWYDYGGSTGHGFASRFLHKGTRVRFCRNGMCVIGTDDDYGPAEWTGRTFDLDKQLFAQLCPLSAGVTTVQWEIVG